MSLGGDIIMTLSDNVSYIVLKEAKQSTNSAMERDSTVVASRWAKVVAGAGSVKSSAGT